MACAAKTRTDLPCGHSRKWSKYHFIFFNQGERDDYVDESVISGQRAKDSLTKDSF